MNRKLNIIAISLLLAGCSGQYIGQPREAMLRYQTEPTYGALYELADAYAQTINAAVGVDTVHPGMFADYGVALALMGHNEEACRWLNAEAVAFPQSRGMVGRITGRVLPSCRIDTTMQLKTIKVDTAQLHRWAYDSLTALRPLPRIATVIDSTDTGMIAVQTPVDSVEIPIRLTANQKRELLAEEQAREERLRQARADSIAAAKQAKLDARRQAQIDKKKAKKEKERVRKAADKAKRQAVAERKKQQELQRRQKANQRKASKKKKK